MEINVGKVKESNGWKYQEQKMFLPGADMEYIRDINIVAAVINILDRSSEEPIFNNFKLNLNENVYTFLYKHCERIFKSDDLQYAIYNTEEKAIKDVNQSFLKGELKNIVDLAKIHTKEFFSIMKSSGIDNCDLITLYLSTEQGAMVGILKMDYDSNFTHSVEFIEGGTSVKLVEHKLSLPGTIRKIKKAVFMKPIRAGQIVDAMIIDKPDKEYEKNYFINFLGCTIIKNKRDETRKFMIATEEFIRRNIENPADAIELRNEIKEKLKNENEINLSELANELFEEDKEQIKAFNEFMGLQSLDRIDVDKKFVDKKLKKVRLTVDRELDMYLSDEYYNDPGRFKVIKNGDGTVDIVLKSIKNYIEK